MREDWSNISETKRAELFPIILKAHDPQWKECYQKESSFLKSIFGDNIIRMNHIGSTAIDGLLAKPTIDILLEIQQTTDLSPITERLLDEGYVVNSPKGDIVMYIKGYTPRGFEGQAVHVHVRHLADWDELYFRDYLISRPDIAREYAALKLRLQGKYMYDRDGYTEAKGEFIKKHSARARQEFPNRYIPL